MSANFTPGFGTYRPLTPFRYWCQKVLPLTYDDSLSYYELLNKVVDYLNMTMEDVETLHDDVDAMLTAFNALQTYVNTYFDELDLTAEVQTVLDRMAENGSLDDLLRPLVGEQIGGVVAEQIDDVVADQIYETVAEQINNAVANVMGQTQYVQNAVTDWLDEHVTPGEAVVDNTLSITGAAADAKVTGDFIKGVNSGLTGAVAQAIENKINKELSYTLIQGVGIGSDGNEISKTGFSSTNYVYIGGLYSIRYSRINMPGTIDIGTAIYDKNFNFISFIAATESTELGYTVARMFTNENMYYARFTVITDTTIGSFFAEGYSYLPRMLNQSIENENLLDTTYYTQYDGWKFYRTFTKPLTAGTYTIHIKGTTNKTSLNVFYIKIYKSTTTTSSNLIHDITVSKDTDTYDTFTYANDIEAICIFTDWSVSNCAGYEITIDDLSIKEGENSAGNNNYSAIDYKAREENGILSNGEDMTARIYNYLTKNKICKLRPGTYYIGELNMPNNTIIEGSGSDTVIKLVTGKKYCIKPGAGCIIRNLTLKDKESFTPDGFFLGSEITPNDLSVYDNLWTNGDITISDDGFVHRVLDTPLEKGTYYIQANPQTQMPNASSCLIAFSRSTDLHITSADIIANVYMEPNTTSIKKFTIDEPAYTVRICSGPSATGSSGYESTWSGIKVCRAGDRCAINWSGNDNARSIIENLWIYGFDCAGVFLEETTQATTHTLLGNNLYIDNCNVGIYAKKNAEYNKFVNCNIHYNYYGYLNRGGNNILANSGLDRNKINAQIDADEGTNGGHGCITGCTLNHSNFNVNDGYSLIIRGTGRMLITGCNFYYGKVRLDSTNGNIINGCGFGNSTGIEIEDCDGNIFANCMVVNSTQSPVTAVGDNFVKFVNCFTRGGANWPET